MTPLKLIILDRDGTINEDRDDYVKSPDEWVPIPGALEAIARLNHAGWHTVVATNQSGLARGLFDTSALNATHTKMNQALAKVGGRIDAVFFCPHGPSEGCNCRKPLPGLFEMIAERAVQRDLAGLLQQCGIDGARRGAIRLLQDVSDALVRSRERR